ncbi:MAG: ATP synthase F1 subunit delta [Dehalococcoidales bacterium]|jgi:F-type H+-transporting ATPase subunit delta|nr:ATP synthase F1 subunit delta [Dehalococcoidales bacterium]MDP6576429.1 ATP synthase F1 subunit delta [Dehalococcoidales bacterium]MDP6825383.1 ATP synthase F1 subunit delta [Dehalococcoidales bacterium]|tara:strand:+ start:270 stop:815 length:546 start_codon:yes stop_codon:yes gene_type:complete
MVKTALARRYAQAVFEIALETKELDRWRSDLAEMAGTATDTMLMALLKSPRLSFDDKAKILRERLKGIRPLALNLARLLVARDKLDIIGDIADDYHQRLDNYRGIEPAEVITAILLDEKDRVKLAGSLGAVVGRKVVLKTAKVDPGLIGGIIARVGGKLLDGSTRGRLVALQRELAGGDGQ